MIIRIMNKRFFFLILAIAGLQVQGQKLDQLLNDVEPKVIEWRRDFHANPELSSREFETAKKVAAFLEDL